MLMNEHDDAYVNAMLMVNMQANTRSVTMRTKPWAQFSNGFIPLMLLVDVMRLWL